MATAGTLASAVLLFLVLPQNHVVGSAGPLPSRLDLTSGWPPPPSGTDDGDWAPWAQFLPSQDLELSLGGGGGGAGVASAARYATLGYTGDRSDDVVLRVRSPLASFWRGFTLDGYDGQGWVTTSQEVRLQVDQKGRLRFAEAPSRLPRGRTYVQSYFLKLEQPNAVFTAYTPGWIALGSGATTGGLEAFRDNVAYLQQADMYRVISPLPYLTPDELRDDRVDISDGAYLVPPPVPDRVRALANDIVEGTTTDYDRAARLERFLLIQYPYDLRTPPAPKDVDAVGYFLFIEQRGYCTQFATAMSVLGRLVGLPTRVAVGYLPGKYNSLTAIHEVRYQDAHAWAEVRFKKHGWVPFDPTPSPNFPWAMGYGNVSLATGFQQVIRSHFMDIFIGGPGRALGDISGFGGPILLLVPAGAAIAILAWFALRRTRRRTPGYEGSDIAYTALADNQRAEVLKVYRQALRQPRRQGQPVRLAHQTPQEYLASVSWGDSGQQQALERLTEWASSAAYDPGPLPDDLAHRARRLLTQLVSG